ncbi:MAG: hypothetical protein HQ589_01105, partial [Syntrophaceae bacterium]|nr:hypothetical protein [Syntrophaceae bacterium]
AAAVLVVQAAALVVVQAEVPVVVQVVAQAVATAAARNKSIFCQGNIEIQGDNKKGVASLCGATP